MNFGQKVSLSLLLTVVVCLPLSAQQVEIPDSNLRSAIVDALGIPRGTPITQDDMNRLTHLGVRGQGIVNLTGLESATNLNYLLIADNPTIDLRPIDNLAQLEHLHMWLIPRLDITPLANLTNLRGLTIAGCDIVDISPLETLTQLTDLNLRYNRIINITPLARLTHLVELGLTGNLIADVTALSGAISLESLEIQDNQIADHGPLDTLALSHFIHDQTCEMPPLPLEPRLENRNYPSIFTRWSGFGWPPVTNRPDLSDAENLALHDLRFSVRVFGLHLLKGHNAFTISGDVGEAIRTRDELLSLNPNKIHLFTLDVREAPLWRFPTDWPGWIRDKHGDVFIEWHKGQPEEDHGIMDFTHPIVQDIVVQQAIAVSKCGLYDGVMFDGWNENLCRLCGRDATGFRSFRSLEEETRALAIIAQRIQAETRPKFLIMGNTNEVTIPISGPYLNGGFMETVVPHVDTGAVLEERLNEVEDSLLWLEQNLREPRINALEGWVVPTESPDSPTNLRWMRAFTTLSLTHSDGYVVYSHSGVFGHYWYDFWDADLRRPVGATALLYDEKIPGLYIREFTNGWAVYNHSGKTQEVTLPEPVTGVASEVEGMTHTLPNYDGEMYLRARPKNPADVNEDGVVNILDLTIIALGFGTDSLKGDVNGDGVVNILDLVQVAGAIGGGAAAPSAYSLDPSIISAADVAKWLAGAQGLGVGDANFQRGIRFLQQLLAALTPKETTLLPNYPNPFNPETWYRIVSREGRRWRLRFMTQKGHWCGGWRSGVSRRDIMRNVERRRIGTDGTNAGKRLRAGFIFTSSGRGTMRRRGGW